MVTNGNIFSSRKEMFIKSQTIFAGRGITATPYNDRWRKHRGLATAWLNTRAVNKYTDVLDKEATVLLHALNRESNCGMVPINPQVHDSRLFLSRLTNEYFKPHAGRCSLNNMLTITFGMRTNSIEHPLVRQALQLSREFMNCTGPMSNLVDFIRPLQFIPTFMQRRGKRLHDTLIKTYGEIIDGMEQDLNAGRPVEDCLAKSMLQAPRTEYLGALDMRILASAFMIGGTAGIMQWFSALIPAYPDIQQKAQEELDRVIGRHRLPNIDDERNLPYCHAIIKEVERCRNPFWLGTPHFSTEDFVYKGHFIPKNTAIVLNTWTMHHNPERYSDPDTFKVGLLSTLETHSLLAEQDFSLYL
ncbi:uncharacterized protein KY384_002204 [Bacidia gigantensis]|uniref:uncharacterized protein n=1 Tax=Bacidia gigantensis TaxID=2732470 RepID=UPI001D04B262|nr:uncharacterized protein KY384_002204 [Bacidia gigantensis]KAG8533421.1 hypothetical protein KY384_002204 [Bacidia gigantensis]